MSERFLSQSDDDAAVGLRYVTRPGGTPSSPLIVMIHGRAGTREVMWLFERVLPKDVAIVSFEAPIPDPIGGFSWWLVGPAASASVAAPHCVKSISRALARFEERHELAPRTRIGIGFSQGAAVLSVAAQRGEVPMVACALLAGFVVPVEAQVNSHPVSRVFVAHGTEDDVVSVTRAREGVAYLQGQGIEVEFVEDAVGHKVGVSGMRRLGEWVAGLLTD